MSEDTMKGVGILEGIAAVLFGIAAVFWPGLTGVTLLYLFATFILISGVVNMMGGVFSIRDKGSAWFLRMIIGILQLGVGVYLLRHPHVTFATLILLIGFTLIFRGVFEVVMAFDRDTLAGSRMLAVISGALAVIAGIIILFQPVSGGVAFVWVLGLYALISGPIIIATAIDSGKA